MATYVPAKKNTAYITYVGLASKADSDILQVNPTLAAGDVKVAIDDGPPANLVTLPVVDADFTKRVKVSLSTDEMNGDNISIIFSDAAGGEWCDLIVNVQTAANQFDDLNIAIAALNDIAVADITGTEVDSDGTAISLVGALKLILSVLAGKSSGGGGSTIVFRDIADSKNRISATVDANGNRTAVGTRDAT